MAKKIRRLADCWKLDSWPYLTWLKELYKKIETPSQYQKEYLVASSCRCNFEVQNYSKKF